MTIQEELNEINYQLKILLGKGSNDETLVTRKRAIQKEIRVQSRTQTEIQ